MWHCEVRDGLLVMKMSSMLFCLVGVVIICSVWVVRSMSKKRLLMSTGYECPCMVQSGQLMSGEVKVASHPEYRVFVSGCEVFDGIAHVVYIL